MTILVLVPFSFYQQSGSSLSTYYRIMALLDLGYDIDIITYPHGNNLPDEKLNILRSPGRKLFSSFQPGEYKKKIVYDNLSEKLKAFKYGVHAGFFIDPNVNELGKNIDIKKISGTETGTSNFVDSFLMLNNSKTDVKLYIENNVISKNNYTNLMNFIII